MIQNVVIGKPIVEPSLLLAIDEDDWNKNEKDFTMFTEERFLPEIMKQSGIVKSISEVRRNKPELMVTLDKLDFLKIKWGKKFLYIVVGE
jgi:hypothetical protein